MANNLNKEIYNNKQSLILCPEDWEDYELIDFGSGKKLERFGNYLFIRPEPQAMFPPKLNANQWSKADGTFHTSNGEESGRWELSSKIKNTWPVHYDGMILNALPTPFRHLGFFPEQAVHWRWCSELIKNFKSSEKPKILNLFAYSGAASLHAAKAGAEVVHVDASKKAIKLAFENRKTSKLDQLPIRFLVDDAIGFVKREIRRGNKYDGIILDPPKYGRGPNGEKWQIENDLQILLKLISEILSNKAIFVVLTSYAIRASHLSLLNSLKSILFNHKGEFSSGELAIREKGNDQRMLGCANFARWKK
mgnify:CR=1 FL=1